MGRIRELELKYDELKVQYDEIEKKYAALLERNSQNSHQPPSQDSPYKERKRKTRTKEEGKRKSGGQKGHKGKNLKQKPADKVVKIAVTGACACGTPWSEIEVSKIQRRQVHDLPKLAIEVTEYQAEVKQCSCCKQRVVAAFPEGVRAPVQYGTRISGLLSYLNAGHCIPLQRSAQILNDLFGTGISEGTVARKLQDGYKRLEAFEAEVKAALLASEVVHADETSSKVNGKLHWVHVVSNQWLTLYSHHLRRGRVALDAINVLRHIRGVIVHDAWSSYFTLPAQHALCNAHLIRELQAVYEKEPKKQLWAQILRERLIEVHHLKKNKQLTEAKKQTFYHDYDALIAEGLNVNPYQEKPPGQKGRAKQTKAHNLASRFQWRKEAILLFLEREDVPFDNNLAERDIRMFCIKRKVSGGFRSQQGAHAFCRIRSFISTLRKQKRDVWQGLQAVFAGQVPQVLVTPAE